MISCFIIAIIIIDGALLRPFNSIIYFVVNLFANANRKLDKLLIHVCTALIQS